MYSYSLLPPSPLSSPIFLVCFVLLFIFGWLDELIDLQLNNNNNAFIIIISWSFHLSYFAMLQVSYSPCRFGVLPQPFPLFSPSFPHRPCPSAGWRIIQVVGVGLLQVLLRDGQVPHPPSILPSFHPSIYPSIHLSMHLFIHAAFNPSSPSLFTSTRLLFSGWRMSGCDDR